MRIAAWSQWIERDFPIIAEGYSDDRIAPTQAKFYACNTQITNWHRAPLSNGPTEAINNLVKRIKRIGFGFRRFRNYRIQALLDAANRSGRSSTPSPPI